MWHNDIEDGEIMRIKLTMVAIALAAMTAIPSSAASKKKENRGMLEKMEAVPCGAKERGLTGLGSIFASIGIQAVNSEEKLCPQYLLRTDDMEYHIRPAKMKKAVILPVGQEGEFKIKKNVMYLKMVDGDKKKRPYQVVAINPLHSGENAQGAAYRSTDRPERYRKPEPPLDKSAGNLSTPPNPPR
jgi:hypothetical protein